MKYIRLILLVFILIFGCNANSKQIEKNETSNKTEITNNKENNSDDLENDVQKNNKTTEEPAHTDQKWTRAQILTETNNSFIYENNGFEIVYPKDWDAIENDGATKLRLVSQAENENDTFREDIAISIKLTSLNDTSESYAKKDVFDIEARIGLKTETEQGIEIGPYSAYRVIFKPRVVGNSTIKQMRTYIIRADVVYLLTLSTEEKQFARYLDITKPIIESFRIT